MDDFNTITPSDAELDEKCDAIFSKWDLKNKREGIIEKAYQDALYQFYKTCFLRQMVTNFMNDGSLPIEVSDTYQRKLIEDQYIQNSTKSFYWFVTVSVKPGVTFQEFEKAVKKQISKKIIKTYFYVYETRHLPDETNKLFEGLHCHMLLYSTVRPYDFKKSTKNTFKDLCTINNPEIMNFKNIPEDLIQDKINYMLGDKKESKQKGVSLTKAFRTRNNIEEYYESTPPFSCRGAKEIL